MNNKATTVQELPALLGGAPIGSTYRIEGYVDSAGATKTLTVKTLAADGYAKMKKESLEMLEKNSAPTVPGFHPAMVAQARDVLMDSYRDKPDKEGTFKDPYVVAKAGGYSTKEGEPSVYLLRLECIDSSPKPPLDPRGDLVRAKAALVKALDLPAGRYLHTVKLTDGKFKSVELVK